MTDYERVNALIAYLHALVEISKSDVRVYDEIRRAVKKLDQLLNN